MTQLNTTTRIKAIITNVKRNSDISVALTDDAKIIEEIGLDSLAIIELMLAIEEEFSIELDFGNIDIKHLYSIRTLADFLEEQTKDS